MKAVLSFTIATLVCAIATVSYVMIGGKDENMQSAYTVSLPVKAKMPSLQGATAWLNSQPLTNEALRGKVVLIDFWTYSCINWRRELPYVRAWAEKYKDKGLVVIGVHTPEFGFEKEVDYVRWAVKDMNVPYPVALDSDYKIWRSFENRYWPALYFVDSQGNIRHHQFGEGDYDKSERVIQQLLRESGAAGVDDQLATVDGRGAEAGADWANLGSPEKYAGFDRTDGFASPGGSSPEKARDYSFPSDLKLNDWALEGSWTIGREATTLNVTSGGVRLQFHARDLHLVMGPASEGKPVPFRILIDGHPPGKDHGIDVDDQGYGTIVETRMYQLIRQTMPISDRSFEIQFLDSGVKLYSFTFG